MEKDLKLIDKEDRDISFSEKIWTILLSVLLGILFDIFFFENVPGVSIPIFTALVIGFFLWTHRKKLEFRKSAGWFLLVPIFLLSLTFALFSNGILAFLNIFIISFLMVCSSMLIIDYKISWSKVNFLGKIIERAISLTLANFPKPFIYISSAVKNTKVKEMSSTKKSIIKGLLLSVPLLIVILALLSSADMVFQHYIAGITGIFDNLELDWGETIPHAIVILLITLYLFGYTWSFKYPARTSEDTDRKTGGGEPLTVLTIIFIINVVYLMFTVIQFSYLYGGDSGALPLGYTYAEYARKGFFELVAVTVINFAILLSSMKFMKRDNKALNNIANIFLTLLILFTLNMLFSAHYKMSLYETSYGLTYLRVFVHYFMLLLLLLFLLALATIWYKRFPLTKAILITSLTMYVILNYINVDKIIASSNIKRYAETGKIDVTYLRRLSFDAVPYMFELVDDKNQEVRTEIIRYLDSKEKEVNSMNSWYEFNYSRYKVKMK